MTRHSWKCVACAQSYRSKTQTTRIPNCPACGQPLVAEIRTVAPPKPRPASERPRSASVSARASSRPAGPEEALALVTSSSAWVPDPDPAPSPDTPGLEAPFTSNRLPMDTPPGIPSPRSPAAPSRGAVTRWAAIGGAVLVVIVGAIVLANRSSARTVNHVQPSPDQTSPAHSSAPVQLASMSPTSEPPVIAPPPAHRVVNLLRMVDPDRDTVSGTWKLLTGEFAPRLSSGGSDHARLNIRYQPPEEYDFRVDFTRTAGDNCMAQMFTDDKPCALILFGWKGTVSGFQQIKNQQADHNSTGVRGLATSNGQRHTSIVKVRKSSIEAWLDGNLITRYDTNGSDLSAKDWKIDAPMGVGTQLSPTIFHTIELTEITGQGKPLQ